MASIVSRNLTMTNSVNSLPKIDSSEVLEQINALKIEETPYLELLQIINDKITQATSTLEKVALYTLKVFYFSIIPVVLDLTAGISKHIYTHIETHLMTKKIIAMRHLLPTPYTLEENDDFFTDLFKNEMRSLHLVENAPARTREIFDTVELYQTTIQQFVRDTIESVSQEQTHSRQITKAHRLLKTVVDQVHSVCKESLISDLVPLLVNELEESLISAMKDQINAKNDFDYEYFQQASFSLLKLQGKITDPHQKWEDTPLTWDNLVNKLDISFEKIEEIENYLSSAESITARIHELQTEEDDLLNQYFTRANQSYSENHLDGLARFVVDSHQTKIAQAKKSIEENVQKANLLEIRRFTSSYAIIEYDRDQVIDQNQLNQFNHLVAFRKLLDKTAFQDDTIDALASRLETRFSISIKRGFEQRQRLMTEWNLNHLRTDAFKTYIDQLIKGYTETDF